MVPVVLVEVYVSCLPRRELATGFVASDWGVAMVDGHMIGDRVVSAVDLPAHRAHEAAVDLLDVLLVATPPFLVVVRHYLLAEYRRCCARR